MSLEAISRITDRLVHADSDPSLHTSLSRMASSDSLKSPHFTFARTDARTGKKLPQAVAHRGYKAVWPENTMSAFRGAVEVGATGLETDIHLTRDGVVVLSHDADLKRCFGIDKKLLDCDWEYVSTLKTLKEPHERMPRLKDLLEYMASPSIEDIWLMLDIKLDNDAQTVMHSIASTIASVSPSTPWHNRIILGVWATSYLPLCAQYLPGFPISHIGFSTLYARRFLAIPHISFNMLQKAMIGPLGKRFLRDARRKKRAVFLWTVNEDKWMRWAVRKGVDGVLTDDPKRYLEVVKEMEGEAGGVRKQDKVTWREIIGLVWINAIIVVFGTMLRLKLMWRGGRTSKAINEGVDKKKA